MADSPGRRVLKVHPWFVAACLGLTFLAGTVSGADAGSSEGAAALDRINQTWQGARCRNRIAVEIDKGSDREGWFDSGWMCDPGSGSNSTEYFCFELKVTNREALLPLMDGKVLRAGAQFVAEGWEAEKTKGLKGVTLNLRFVDVPARARIHFTKRGSFNKVGTVERLMYIERYMRFEAFEVRPPDERIDAVAPPVVVATPRPRPAATPVPVRPELRLMAASVEPARIIAGETVRLIAIYAVEGLPSDAFVEVMEWRTIRQGQRTLTTTDASLQQGPGIHQSSQPLKVPATLGPGVYELLVTIECQGVVKEATAVFEVLGREP